jgi:hypothetical protein
MAENIVKSPFEETMRCNSRFDRWRKYNEKVDYWMAFKQEHGEYVRCSCESCSFVEVTQRPVTVFAAGPADSADRASWGWSGGCLEG